MRKVFWLALIVVLAACGPASTAAVPVSPTFTQHTELIIPVSGEETTNTSAPLPSKTKSITARLTTPSPPPTATTCLHLIRPASGVSLSTTGNVDFAWESQPGGLLYVLSLISHEGRREDARSTTTTMTRSIKGTSKSGLYFWSVSAYNAQGYFICNSGFLPFLRGKGGIDKLTAVAAVAMNEQPSATASGTDELTPAGTAAMNEQTSMTTSGAEGQIPLADQSSTTLFTFDELVNNGLIPPPPIPPVPASVELWIPPFIDPNEFSSSDNAKTGSTEIVPPTSTDTAIAPPAPPATPADSGVTEVVPTEPPATDAPTEKPPPTDLPPTDPPPTDSPPTDPPATDPPATDPPAGG